MRHFETFKDYQNYNYANVAVFARTFKPWKKWEDVCLSDLCPCNGCDISKELSDNSRYYQMSEGAAEELTKPCKKCHAYLQWTMECLEKLKWYEEHDERLNPNEGKGE